MGKSENLVDSLNNKLSVTRRNFVKSAMALGAAGTLYGCSKDDNDDVVYQYGGGSDVESPAAPAISEKVVAGSAPHNCGGGCVIKAYVSEKGVIKRFTTDETPEKTYLDKVQGDYMQDRACPRCRSQKSWIYSSNRLMYPMIQRGKRGDLETFERVSWEEASNYYKEKAQKVMSSWGPGAFHNIYSSGMGGGYDPSGVVLSLIGATGKNLLRTHDDYSFPQWELITRCMHDANSQPRSNDFQDVYNSDELVIWGYNLSEMLNQQQINFTTVQIHEIFKEQKKKITVIDPKYTNTAILAADEFLAPVQGTDTAMIFGMLHYMLTDCKDELIAMYNKHGKLKFSGSTDAEKANYIRQAIGQYVYGFFDTNPLDEAAGTNDSYTLDGADQLTFKDKCKVNAGASLSAYIFGNSTKLVDAGLNLASSIYPDKVGYNVRSYDIDGDGGDPLKDKFTDCYGQVEKTPEWASKICGVSVDAIKSLTKRFLTKNVSCWIMGGLQRNSEGDQVCWAWPVLMNIFLCFGKEGRSHGRADGRGNDLRKSITSSWKRTIDNNEAINNIPDKFLKSNGGYLATDKQSWADPIGDLSLLTFGNNSNSNHSSDTISVFTWLDACDATNRAKVNQERFTITNGAASKVTESVYPSHWNDGQVKWLPTPTKFIFHCGGNININQNGDCNMGVKVLTATDEALKDALNPNGYKVEFLGMIDVVMTSSCRYADLVLPGSISFERYQTHAGGRSPLTSVTTKAVNPPGDAKVEMEIAAEIANAFGKKAEFYGNRAPVGDKTFEQMVWETDLNDPINTAKFGMDAKAWSERGFHKTVDDLTKLDNYIAYKAFLANPGSSKRVTSANKANNAVKTCFITLSGRVEAYCLPMMENYEMRNGNNIDERAEAKLVTPLGTAITPELYTKVAEARNLKSAGRFVYPIPMYIPLIEGRHADDSHPDPLGLKTEFPLNLLTWHTIYRSHSTFNSSPLANEVKYYKRNAKGEQAFLNNKITNISDQKAPSVWLNDVYETVWLHPETAKQSSQGEINEGDLIIVESKRGKIAASAHISKRVRPGTVSMTQGSWFAPVDNFAGPSGTNHGTVDVGGNANTLFGLRPTRICAGMSLASECRIKIYKA